MSFACDGYSKSPMGLSSLPPDDATGLVNHSPQSQKTAHSLAAGVGGWEKDC